MYEELRDLTNDALQQTHRESIKLMDLAKKRSRRGRVPESLEDRHTEIVLEMKRRAMV